MEACCLRRNRISPGNASGRAGTGRGSASSCRSACIVAVAIVCVVIAVLTSAQRADEVSAQTANKQLLETAIAGKGVRLLRELDSAAATERATDNIRNDYDPQWVDPPRPMADRLLSRRRRGGRRRQ